MDDLISRQGVFDALNGIKIPRNATWYQYYRQALDEVGCLPTISKVRTADDCISREAAIDCLNNVSFDCSMDQEVVEDELLKLPSIQPEQRWIPVTETPPYGKDLMLKLHDRRRGCDCFYYFAMGFYDGREYHTYLFEYQDDHDLEVVGWQLCPWEGEQE